MKVILDGVVYTISLSDLASFIQAYYKHNASAMNKITFDNGRTIDFSSKSIARIALKTALVPIAVPMLKLIYGKFGLELPKHDRHEDFIDYFVHHTIGILRLFEMGSIYVQTIESIDDNNGKTVISLSTNAPGAIASPSNENTREESRQEETIGTGREALVHRGENGYGQDETSEGNYQGKNEEPTVS